MRGPRSPPSRTSARSPVERRGRREGRRRPARDARGVGAGAGGARDGEREARPATGHRPPPPRPRRPRSRPLPRRPPGRPRRRALTPSRPRAWTWRCGGRRTRSSRGSRSSPAAPATAGSRCSPSPSTATRRGSSSSAPSCPPSSPRRFAATTASCSSSARGSRHCSPRIRLGEMGLVDPKDAPRLGSSPMPRRSWSARCRRPGTATCSTSGWSTPRPPRRSPRPRSRSRMRDAGRAVARLVVLRSRTDALYRSLLAPGWGQLYNRQPVKAGLFAAAELALLGGALAFQLEGAKAERDYQGEGDPRRARAGSGRGRRRPPRGRPRRVRLAQPAALGALRQSGSSAPWTPTRSGWTATESRPG